MINIKVLKETVQNIKLRTLEEQVIAEKELKNYEKKHGLKAVNKKLREEFGL